MSPHAMFQRVPELPPQQWAPLFEAVARFKVLTGSRDLAERDLLQALRGQGLRSAVRIIEGNTETRLTLTAEFWKAEVAHLRPGLGDAERVVYVRRAFPGTTNFLVHRGDLDRLTTIATEPKRTRATKQQDAIRKLADERWPDGWQDIPTKVIIKEVGMMLAAKNQRVPERDAFLRALNRRKG